MEWYSSRVYCNQADAEPIPVDLFVYYETFECKVDFESLQLYKGEQVDCRKWIQRSWHNRSFIQLTDGNYVYWCVY